MKLVPGLRRDGVWMPVFTGMTSLIALFAITTQSLHPNDDASVGVLTPIDNKLGLGYSNSKMFAIVICDDSDKQILNN